MGQLILLGEEEAFILDIATKQNQIQNDMGYYIWETFVSVGIGLSFFHTALNIFIPSVISGIPTQNYPRKT